MVRVSPDGTAVASELSGTPHDVPARRPAKRQRTSSLPTASDFWIDSLPGFHGDFRLSLYGGNLPSATHTTPPAPAADSDAHLYFLLARNKHIPKRERLVIWLNGGPGCSSFDGALIELGPLRIDESGTPRVVEGTAWNEYANVLFLDQPAGTGFSYVTKNDNVRELADAADQVVNFLANFYRVFPEFSSMDTYIAGESYAGQYIPYIADAIEKTTIVNTPLKGLLIGNGWISPREQYPAYLDYLLDQRLVKENSQAHRNIRRVLDKCEEKLATIEKDNGGKGMVLVGECEQILGAVGAATGKDGLCLNLYDTREYHACGTEWPPALKQVSGFLRSRNVVKALHAEKGPESHGPWTQCSSSVGAKFWTPNSVPSVVLLPQLLEKMPILLYNGDKDAMCPGIGIEKMIDKLEWNGATGFVDAAPLDWSVDGESAGRWTTARNLTYVEVFNSSHMVPMDKPLAAHDMLLRFMQVDTLHSAGSAAKIPSRIGSSPEAVLAPTHPNGTALVPPSVLDTTLDGVEADGSAEKVIEDGYDVEHERQFGPRRTAALVVFLLLIVGALWGIVHWRKAARRERYRKSKGKGRASVPLDERRQQRESKRGHRRDEGAYHDDRPEPTPDEAPETVAVFDIGEEDEYDEEERRVGRRYEDDEDEDGKGDLGKAAEDANPWRVDSARRY
ncbi:Cell death protease [Rhodotorula toruloides]|uniref:Carboxypeptidase n=1 Tax=Rhodotorula toruloides TaxID=5286 RepID=A0A0K3CH33_RHOTO